jgi:hypothetical protein
VQEQGPERPRRGLRARGQQDADERDQGLVVEQLAVGGLGLAEPGQEVVSGVGPGVRDGLGDHAAEDGRAAEGQLGVGAVEQQPDRELVEPLEHLVRQADDVVEHRGRVHQREVLHELRAPAFGDLVQPALGLGDDEVASPALDRLAGERLLDGPALAGVLGRVEPEDRGAVRLPDGAGVRDVREVLRVAQARHDLGVADHRERLALPLRGVGGGEAERLGEQIAAVHGALRADLVVHGVGIAEARSGVLVELCEDVQPRQGVGRLIRCLHGTAFRRHCGGVGLVHYIAGIGGSVDVLAELDSPG